MFFYRSTPPLNPIIVGDSGLILRAPLSSDYLAWKEIRLASQEFLTPWEPLWPTNDLTRLGYRRRLKRYERELYNRTGATYFLVSAKDNLPMGGITISNIRQGVARCCNIGYWMGEAHSGQGHMGKAVAEICRHIFAELQLCRIEAACLPENTRSARLLISAGFEREGLLRQYLEINGQRHDHVLFSLLNEN